MPKLSTIKLMPYMRYAPDVEGKPFELYQIWDSNNAILVAAFETYEQMLEMIARHICEYAHVGSMLPRMWAQEFFAECGFPGERNYVRVSGKRLFTEALGYG